MITRVLGEKWESYRVVSVSLLTIVVSALLLTACSAGSDSSDSANPPSYSTPPSDTGSEDQTPGTDLMISPDQEVFLENLLDAQLSENDALEMIQSSGYTARVGERNGEQFMLTMDYSKDRLTLIIVNDVVTDAYWG